MAVESVLDPLPSCPVPRQTDQGHRFLTDHPLRRIRVDGEPGFAATVRLPSYRSLPLCCIEHITITVDGVVVPEDRLRLRLDGRTMRVDELGALSTVWWFILDTAELLVAHPLGEAAEHEIDASLVTVEPYVSNGRFHLTSTASARLAVDELLSED